VVEHVGREDPRNAGSHGALADLPGLGT